MDPTGPHREDLLNGSPLGAGEPGRAQEASQNSERWLGDSMPHSISEVVSAISTDGTVRYVSPNVERVFGYRAEELVGTRPVHRVHREDRTLVLESFAEASKRPGMSPSLRFRVRAADGSWRHVEAIPSNLLDEPDVQGFVISVRDVTEVKRAEELLRQSRERFKAQYKGFPIPTYSWRKVGEDFVLVDFNDAAREFTHGGVNGLLGKRATELWPEESIVVELMTRCLEEKSTLKVETPWTLLRSVERKHLVVSCVFILPDMVMVHTEDVTEQKEAEERIRFQARLLDTVGQAVVATDRQGKIVYWNSAAEQLYGWSAEEAAGSSVLEVTLPEQTPNQREEIMLWLREGRSWSGEFGLRRKDGTVFPAMVTTTPVVNEGSDLEGIISVSTDITERKRAEEALRRSQKRFRSLVQNSSDVITILDEDGTVRYASPALGQIIGYAPEERVGRRGFELIHPEDRERMLRVYAEVRKVPGVRRAAEVRCRHKDGSWRHLEAIVHNLLEDPSVRGMVVNARDVTERVRTEARLREAEERYRTLIEQIPAVTYIDRADGSDEPLYTSPRIEELLGYTPQEWLEGRLWPERLHPDDRERVLVADEHFESGAGEQFSEEYRLIAKDGSVVWVREEAVLVEDELGNPLFWQGILHDITERKEAEEALMRSEANLADSQRIAHLGTWEWDIVTGEVWWSDETYRIHGFDPGRQLDFREKVEEAFFPEDLPRYRRKIDEALSGEAEGYDYEHRIRRPHGEVRWVHGQAEVVRGEGGEPLRMIGTVHDVTERSGIHLIYSSGSPVFIRVVTP